MDKTMVHYSSVPVSAGFPSPARDYIEHVLDLNDLLVLNASATYVMRVVGESMTKFGVFNNDEIIVDRSLTARDNSVVVAVLNNGFVIKKFRTVQGTSFLQDGTSDDEHGVFMPDVPFSVWGVVTRSLHKLI